MSSTNKTPNYALPQFVPTDKPTWLGDVNAAMLAIDTAMADNHTIAEGANTTAAGAEAKVQAAVDTANEAKVDSAAALQTATSATGVAQNALTAATSATQTANAASTQAQQAAGTATQASAVATAASNLANQTAAGLTEFEHYFTLSVPCINGRIGVNRVNPAYIALIVEGNQEINTNGTIFWEYSKPALNVSSEWVYFVSDNLELVAQPFDGTSQKISLRTKTGTYTLPKSFIFFSTYNLAAFKAFTASVKAVALSEDAQFPICWHSGI